MTDRRGEKPAGLTVLAVLMGFICIGMGRTAWAAPVTRERAARAARGWLRSAPAMVPTPSALRSDSPVGGSIDSGQELKDDTGQVVAYKFRTPGGGSLVIAGDDRFPPVLFESRIGDFDPHAVPMVEQIWNEFAQRMAKPATKEDGGDDPD